MYQNFFHSHWKKILHSVLPSHSEIAMYTTEVNLSVSCWLTVVSRNLANIEGLLIAR